MWDEMYVLLEVLVSVETIAKGAKGQLPQGGLIEGWTVIYKQQQPVPCSI